MNNETDNADETLCPVCQAKNLCAIANNSEGSSCWCQQTSFPSELLKQYPSNQCICRDCAEKAQQLATKIP